MAMTLRLNPEDERTLALLAETEGVSKQEAILRAIRAAAARSVHEADVRELSVAARERYATVLKRLGE
ncbi:CopG family transcriptional regulator [Brooklawnia sp.]|uniref:CopG family transcriptional regulator n=1 Tax=Brooklawnia sp. TaxID=2699740 RepID=UPI003120065D